MYAFNSPLLPSALCGKWIYCMFVVFVCTVHSHRRQRGTSHHCTVFPYLVIGAPYRALTDKI